MKKKISKVLFIGFSINRQYPQETISDFIKNYDEAKIIFPYLYFWRFNPLIFFEKIIFFLRNFFLKKSLSEYWITPSNLIKINFNKKIHVLNINYNYNLKNLFKAYNDTEVFFKLIKKNKIFRFKIFDIECSSYLLDSLLRFVPGFKIYNPSFFNFLSTWLYLYNILSFLDSLNKYLKKSNITAVVINHQVYMESGFISCFLKKKYTSDIYHLNSRYKNIVKVEPRKKWFKELLNKKLKKNYDKFIYNQKDIWKQKHAVFELGDLSKRNINPKKILIFMHSFIDANGLHPDNNVIFNSYYQWIKETIKIAVLNPDIMYVFRPHPASYQKYHYRSDLKIIKNLFHKKLPKNIILKKITDNESEFFKDDKLPVFITAKGNISQELAISGIKCITLDSSSTPDECCHIVKSMKEYISWLSGLSNVNCLKLSPEQKKLAYKSKSIYAWINNMV
jgi:hypothetical protein